MNNVIMKCISSLQDERQNSLPALGIVTKLLAVVPVLAQSPHGHLEHASGSKEVRRNALGHHGERQPREELVGIIRTGHVTKKEIKLLIFLVFVFLNN